MHAKLQAEDNNIVEPDQLCYTGNVSVAETANLTLPPHDPLQCSYNCDSKKLWTL